MPFSSVGLCHWVAVGSRLKFDALFAGTYVCQSFAALHAVTAASPPWTDVDVGGPQSA